MVSPLLILCFYSHFSDLKESLQRNRPKSWESYKKVERGLYSVEYYPPVKELKRSGDILFLKKKIADEALDLILRIDKLNKKLERKAKEPVGFWETMFGAFADMFR